MIAELFFIMDALQTYESQPTTPTVVTVTPRKSAKTPTPDTTASLAGSLGLVGKTTQITMPVKIVTPTPGQAARDYLEASKGVKKESITAKLRGGRL